MTSSQNLHKVPIEFTLDTGILYLTSCVDYHSSLSFYCERPRVIRIYTKYIAWKRLDSAMRKAKSELNLPLDFG